VLVEPRFSIICLNVFYTSAIRNAFSFHKLPIIRFVEHFLQISHKLRTISGQNNMSGGSWSLMRMRVQKNAASWNFTSADFFQNPHIHRVTQIRVTLISSLLRILCNLTPLHLAYNALTYLQIVCRGGEGISLRSNKAPLSTRSRRS